MKKFTIPFTEYVAESTAACLVTMVQGNLLIITASHLLIASQTGLIAGFLAAVTLAIAKTKRRWVISLVLGLIAGLVDYYVHPGMFGSVATEAIITGLAAALLSYLLGTSFQYFRQKKQAAAS